LTRDANGQIFATNQASAGICDRDLHPLSSARMAICTPKCPPGSPEWLWAMAFVASSVTHSKTSETAAAGQDNLAR
jgi:hypothetical protein